MNMFKRAARKTTIKPTVTMPRRKLKSRFEMKT